MPSLDRPWIASYHLTDGRRVPKGTTAFRSSAAVPSAIVRDSVRGVSGLT
jgi:hypothetical protein